MADTSPGRPIGSFARELFAPIGGDYDRVAAVLSFGQDPRWRRALVRSCPVPQGSHIARRRHRHRRRRDRDGSPLRRPGHRPRPVGGDARERTPARPSRRARRAHRATSKARAEAMPFDDATFDGVTSTYFLRYVEDVPAAIGELVRVAKPGAPVGYLDFGVPPLPPARLAWEAYTRAGLPLAGRAIGHGWLEVGPFPARLDPLLRRPLPARAARRAARGVGPLGGAGAADEPRRRHRRDGPPQALTGRQGRSTVSRLGRFERWRRRCHGELDGDHHAAPESRRARSTRRAARPRRGRPRCRAR